VVQSEISCLGDKVSYLAISWRSTA